MLTKIVDFFIILAVCLVAFASLEYVAFGHTGDDGSTLTLYGTGMVAREAVARVLT